MRGIRISLVAFSLAACNSGTERTSRAEHTSVFGGTAAAATTTDGIPPSLTTPDQVDSRIGTLAFKDGMPSEDTIARVYDNLDRTHAFEAFVNTFQGVSVEAVHRGLQEAGVKDNEVIVFSTLMDSNSLFLTANADTVYAISAVDLSRGPMVVESPPGLLGAVDDAWFRWVIDIGLPGPDRGSGGRYLLVPPGYEGPLPTGGYFVAHARTNLVVMFGRSFLENRSDPKPAADAIRRHLKVYPYTPGGYGTPLADFLSGESRLGQVTPPPETVFHEGSGKVMNTVPPNDLSFYTMLNDVVQREPATALDPELMGPLAAIGIVKGKPFAPDARMKTLLQEGVTLANATSRTLAMHPRDPSWFFYPSSAWWNPLFVSGYQFETPIPEITGPVRDGQRIPEGVKVAPPTGFRMLDARTLFFYAYTGITPAMAMRLTGVGSQYLLATLDANQRYFDGSKTYKVTLPKGIPEANFWSLTLYDNQSRSMLRTPQRFPRAGSQSYPSPAAQANADGSTTVYFSPAQPAGIGRGNWIQTDPTKGFFVCLRLYSPLEPFFDKSWRPSEIVPVP